MKNSRKHVKEEKIGEAFFVNEISKTETIELRNENNVNTKYIHYVYSSISNNMINPFIKRIEIIKKENDINYIEAYYYNRQENRYEITDKSLLKFFSSIDEIRLIAVNGVILLYNFNIIFATIEFSSYKLVTLDTLFKYSRHIIEYNVNEAKIESIHKYKGTYNNKENMFISISSVEDSSVSLDLISFKVKVDLSNIDFGIYFGIRCGRQVYNI
ncbi:MAG: hypothetical protein IJ809_06290 [Clostridia bacterium]|nr:hypothetical protein [Clostridia bacterium]